MSRFSFPDSALAALDLCARVAPAMARSSWAAGLWLGQRLTEPLGPPHRLRALDRFSLSARRRVDPVSQLMLLLDDDMRRTAKRYLPRDLSALSWRRAAGRLKQDALASLAILGDGRGARAARLELAQKVEVYWLVRRAGASLGSEAYQRRAFLAAAQRILELDQHHMMWAIEGLAYRHSEAVLRREPEPEGLMRELDLPDSVLIMAHLGMGMAIAERVLLDVYPDDDRRARKAVARFQRLCRINSNPPQLDAALESFGLLVRCFLPELVSTLDRALSRDGGAESRDIHNYYWHGVGRALYFLPLHLLPGYSQAIQALRRADEESPHPEALLQTRAGVAYAFTLVSLATPEVMEELVRTTPEQVDEAFLEGMVSALLLRSSMNSDDPDLRRFLDHRPKDPEVEQRWRETIGREAERAFDTGSAAPQGTVARAVTRLTQSRARAETHRGESMADSAPGTIDKKLLSEIGTG